MTGYIKRERGAPAQGHPAVQGNYVQHLDNSAEREREIQEDTDSMANPRYHTTWWLLVEGVYRSLTWKARSTLYPFRLSSKMICLSTSSTPWCTMSSHVSRPTCCCVCVRGAFFPLNFLNVLSLSLPPPPLKVS